MTLGAVGKGEEGEDLGSPVPSESRRPRRWPLARLIPRGEKEGGRKLLALAPRNPKLLLHPRWWLK